MTSGFNGDYYEALKSIKAKTLILAGEGDLLNPEANAREAAQYIPDARYVTLKTRIARGHWSGGRGDATGERTAEPRDRCVPRYRHGERAQDPVRRKRRTAVVRLELAHGGQGVLRRTL